MIVKGAVIDNLVDKSSIYPHKRSNAGRNTRFPIVSKLETCFPPRLGETVSTCVKAVQSPWPIQSQAFLLKLPTKLPMVFF